MKFRHIQRSALALHALLSLGSLAGCVSHDDEGYRRRRPRQREVIVEDEEHYHRSPPVGVEPDTFIVERGLRAEGRGPALRSHGIPRAAALVDEGKGRIGFSSRGDGDLWIEDTHDLKLVFEGRLFDGEEVVVEPARDTITINDRRVRVNGLVNEHRHRIYFIPASGHFERYERGHDPRFDR